jgi:endonuclease/exonuclease/phosphatase family metal-dependent hydrolase
LLGGDKADVIKPLGIFTKYQIICQPAIRTAKRGRAKAGLVMMVKRNLLQIIDSTKTENCILASLKCIKNNSFLNVGCMYIQPSDPDRRLEELMFRFNSWMENNSNNNIILCGDFNARIGSLDVKSAGLTPTMDLSERRQACDKKVNSQGRNLLEAIEDMNLTLLNGRSRKDRNGEFTYIGHSGSSTIDLCFLNNVAAMQMTSFKIGSQALSSHCPLQLELGPREPISYRNEYRFKWMPAKHFAYQNCLSLTPSIA